MLSDDALLKYHGLTCRTLDLKAEELWVIKRLSPVPFHLLKSLPCRLIQRMFRSQFVGVGQVSCLEISDY